MSPEQAEEQGPYDDDDEYDYEYEPAREWQPGECDMCAGPPPTQAERAAALASAITPVCACWLGQGDPDGDCLCGPQLFEDQEGEGEVQRAGAGATLTIHDHAPTDQERRTFFTEDE